MKSFHVWFLPFDFRLINDFTSVDNELSIYAITLINKTLSNLSDIDKFYDESDCLEQLRLFDAMQYYTKNAETDLELLGQFNIYETVLRNEDGKSEILDWIEQQP